MSQADKDEEARLAADLLGDGDVEEEDNSECWRCQCGSINDNELECCSKCALPQVALRWVLAGYSKASSIE